MKKFLCFILSILLLTSCGNTTQSNIYLEERLIRLNETSNQSISDVLSPAIVGVQTNINGISNIGAGVCVAPGGIVITNSHVINSSDDISLYLIDGTIISAEVLYEDTVLDFAILVAESTLPYLPINTNLPKVGEEVIAVGTPISLMLKHTFTKGIVSAINRTIKINTTNGEAYMQNLLQHDASLNPGNSGGPLLNMSGEVVGINTLKITSGEGIGFAIPSKSFVSLIDKLSNTNQLSNPYLGVYGYDAEIAKFNKLTNTDYGFFVEDVNNTSPLYNILHAGDTITAINGVKINNAVDFRHELYKYSPTDTIILEYVSEKDTKKIKLRLTSNNIS